MRHRDGCSSHGVEEGAVERARPAWSGTPGPMRILVLVLGMLALASLGGPGSGAGATSVLETFRHPLEMPTAGGLEQVDRALAKLTGHRRVLVIGAHPDDEDTTTLALVSRGLGGEAAYLSLSRGEGGQNLIGPELGPALGLIRSRELLAARQVDGARQYFARAYDFGYTRSLEETLELWPREVLMEDTVRVIRRFRPQVILSVFPPDARAGHGQHQAAGLVAGDAYVAAGDPGAFPEMAAEGLPPWSPQALYRNTWWRGREETTVTQAAGVLEPYSGRSVFQVAMDSRSQHRSQDMGRLLPLGPQDVRLGWEAGGAGVEGDHLFAGVDTRLAAMAAGLSEGEVRTQVEGLLSRVQAQAEEARAELTPVGLEGAVPRLAEIVRDLRRAGEAVRGMPETGLEPRYAAARVHATELIAEKVAVAEAALAAAAGVAVDAVADREVVAPGDGWDVEAMLWNAARRDDVVPRGVELASPAGLAMTARAVEGEERTGWASWFVPGDDPERGFHVRHLRADLAEDAEPSVPYFLERPLDGALYDWSTTPPDLQGEPFDPPLLVARFDVEIAGVGLVLEREVVHRDLDQAIGEIRRPLRVAPRLEVALTPDLIVQPLPAGAGAEPAGAGPVDGATGAPAAAAAAETGTSVADRAAAGVGSAPTAVRSAAPAGRHLRVTLTNRARRPLSGQLLVDVPPGWQRRAGGSAFSLAPAGEPGDRAELAVVVTPTAEVAPGFAEIRVAAVVEGESGIGRQATALPLVDYEHIRATPYPEPAVAAVSVADVELPDLDRVGYVRGASDRVPEALLEIGLPLELLSPEALLEADLSAYDAIVVGSRAYEVEPALARANPRLLDYARAGGLLIVQYQQYQFVQGGYAPYPLEIDRPHGRVTDEAAPVRLLAPEHPVFNTPNAIAPADWQGWVQERALYMPATWDQRYAPLLSMKDPDQDADQQGAVLVAPVGDGTWVYTGLAFFRQLPAGVPGAYRLFANLLALE